jgi:hypothetical protein
MSSKLEEKPTEAAAVPTAEPASEPIAGPIAGPASEQAAAPAGRASHPALRYTSLRLAIFVIALILLWLVRVRGALLVVLALIISGLASYVLLRSQRVAMAAQFAAASERRRTRAARRAAREDDIAEELSAAERAAADRR